jgi:coenzyme F420-reducing hydrogenase alpha subunit
MSQTNAAKKIDVHYLTRVEGHGNIVVEIDAAGTVQTCRWEVPEAPRFFEAMVLGKRWDVIHQITSRICGICSIGHQLASLQATEEALGIRVSRQTTLLRKLAIHGENLQSHYLHVGYLALPDFLGVGSVIPLAATHKKELTTLIGLRRLANEFSQAICGRTTHPQRLFPGGFLKVPTTEELKTLKKRLNDSLKALDAVVDLVASVAHRIPAFLRETEYVALVHPGEYPLLWGQVGTSQDQSRPASEYLNLTNEYLVPQSTAKWSKNQAKSYMVGALARFNLNHERLHPGAKKAAGKLGLAAPCHNPYFITVAQLVECVHSTEDSVRILDELLKAGVKPEAPTPVAPQAGKGSGAVEVPRGILFHSYEYDDEGRVCHADCVIPTNQNHANIQYDMAALTPLIKDEPAEDIELKLSMLVRAYDPCISCSTHCLDLKDRGVIWRQVD